MKFGKRKHFYKKKVAMRKSGKPRFYTHPRYKYREPFAFFYGRKSRQSYVRIVVGSLCMLVALGLVSIQLLKIQPEEDVKAAWERIDKSVSEPVPFVDAGKIRVLIKTENFEKEFHEVLQLSSPEGLSVSVVSGGAIQQTKMVAAGEVFTVQPAEWALMAQSLRIETKSSHTGIQINSVKRSCGYPLYSGLFDIFFTAEGMVLVNEVSLEEYLYGVVPSEMPESFGLEALKAQAVCARSYAYLRMRNPGYPQYQAAVDDSVKYQVYNNYEVTQAIKEAVDATAGEIGMYNGSVIDAYFFSTSCGVTTDWRVWGADAEKEYLAGVELTEEKALPDLCDEDAFKNYIDTENQSNYDSHAAWYRWEAQIDFSKIEESWKEKNGEIKSIEIKERGCGGVINKLRVIGEKGEKIIQSEYDVRDFLGALLVKCKNQESESETMPSMLPSAFFYIVEQKEGKAVLKGGGYGHGCGMSQNGARGMAQQGKNYAEILTFFYEGIELKKIY